MCLPKAASSSICSLLSRVTGKKGLLATNPFPFHGRAATQILDHCQVEQGAVGVDLMSLALRWPDSGLAATLGLQVPPRVRWWLL